MVLSLLLWLLVPRYPRLAAVALAYGLFLTGRLYVATGAGCLYFLLVQLAAIRQSPALWGYLAAVYPAASGNTLAGSAPGILALLILAGLTRLRPSITLLGAAACAATLAFIERRALAGWLIPPPIHLTLDPLDALLPVPSLGLFAVCCLLLQPGRARHLGLLLWTGSMLSPYPGPWLLLAGALALARDKRSTLALTALGLVVSAGPWLYLLRGGSLREYRLSHLRKGQVLAAQELSDLLPPDKLENGHIKFPRFAPLAVREEVAPSPDWLLVSNNPEIVRSPGNLFRGTLPAGRGRLFLSHFNPHPPPTELTLTLRNPGPTDATVTTQRKVWFAKLVPDAGTELLREFLSAGPGPTVTIPPGKTHHEGLQDLLGNGLFMADLTLDQPLDATVSMGAVDLNAPVQGKIFRQSRGLYLKPDRLLTAQATLGTEILACEPLPQPLKGPDELKGSYGALETLDFKVTSNSCRRALILLVPRAGYLGAVLDGQTYAINPYGALVLAELELPSRWKWVYSLPANSFAPNGILIVPVR